MKTKIVRDPRWMPREEFDAIYGRVPRLSVDMMVRTPQGIVMTKRSIEPCMGQWHLPGGTVLFGENLIEAVQRIALSEIGVEVEVGKLVGYFEYSRLAKAGQPGWTIAVVFEAKITSGELRGSEQGEEVGFFTEVPDNTIPDQAAFMKTVI